MVANESLRTFASRGNLIPEAGTLGPPISRDSWKGVLLWKLPQRSKTKRKINSSVSFFFLFWLNSKTRGGERRGEGKGAYIIALRLPPWGN